MNDVIQFSFTLPKIKKTAFLIVVSAPIWCISKHRNDVCFNYSIIHSCRNTVLTIVSVISYWTGPFSEKIKESTKEWIPDERDAIPLQVASPEDEQLLEWVTDDKK